MMSFNSALFAASLLTALLAVPGVNAAENVSSDDAKMPSAIDARALLEKGLTASSLPQGMVVQISACLGQLDKAATEEGIPANLVEHWEFTSKQVHRIVREDNNGKRAIESRPFDSKGLCKDLLEGKAMEIQARKGDGPQIAFAGSPYRKGSRVITVLWEGQTILDLHETNGALLILYAESDARAFGALYERLASQARLAFKPQNGEVN